MAFSVRFFFQSLLIPNRKGQHSTARHIDYVIEEGVKKLDNQIMRWSGMWLFSPGVTQPWSLLSRATVVIMGEFIHIMTIKQPGQYS